MLGYRRDVVAVRDGRSRDGLLGVWPHADTGRAAGVAATLQSAWPAQIPDVGRASAHSPLACSNRDVIDPPAATSTIARQSAWRRMVMCLTVGARVPVGAALPPLAGRVEHQEALEERGTRSRAR